MKISSFISMLVKIAVFVVLLLVVSGLVLIRLKPKFLTEMLPEVQHDVPKTTSVWTEEEIAGLTLDLISKTHIETFSFAIDADGLHTVSCVFGKKGGWLTAPVEYWAIDSEGALLIYANEENPSKDCITLKKRKIDADGIAHVFRNGKPEMYFCARREK